MDWLTRFAFLLLLIIILHKDVDAGNIFGEENTPPTAPNSSHNFATAFVNYIVASGAFPEQEEEDMKEFVQTLSVAISSLSNSKWASRAKVEALSMAFASALAELVVIEDDENNTSTDSKTKVIADALAQAFKETTGSVNTEFIEEIQELLHVFAHAVVSGINEADGTAPFLPSAPEHNAKLAGAFELASGISAPSAVAPINPPISASSQFTDQIYNTLINDAGFNSVIESGVSPGTINALASSIAGSVASAPEFSSVGYTALVNAYQQAISSEKDGASVSGYARAIARATTKVLDDAGIFSTGIAPEHITAAVGSITSGINSASGISLGKQGLKTSDSDIASTSPIVASQTSHIPAYTAPAGTPAISISFARQIYTSLLTDQRFISAFQVPISLDRVKLYLVAIARSITSIRTYSAVSINELLNSYLDSIIGIPPASSIPVYAQAIARITAATFSKYDLLTWDSVNSDISEVQNVLQNALASATINDNEVSGGQVILATSPEGAGNWAPAGQAPIVSASGTVTNDLKTSSLATSSDNVEIRDQYNAPDGTPPVSVAFAKKIYADLLGNNRFLAIFQTAVSETRIRIYLRALAKSLCALPRYNSINDEELLEGYVEAISSIPVNAEANIYAQEIATITAIVLYENNLLTWQAVTAGTASLLEAINSALSTASEIDNTSNTELDTIDSISTTTSTNDQKIVQSTSDISTKLTQEIPNSYTPPPGTTPVARGFGTQLYTYLIADIRFSALFGENYSLQTARSFLTAFATSISSIPQFSSVTVNELVTRYIQVITTFPYGSNFHIYAQAIAQTTAEILNTRKLLNLQIVSAIATSLKTAIETALQSTYVPGTESDVVGPASSVFGTAPGVSKPSTGTFGTAPGTFGPATDTFGNTPVAFGPPHGTSGPGIPGTDRTETGDLEPQRSLVEPATGDFETPPAGVTLEPATIGQETDLLGASPELHGPASRLFGTPPALISANVETTAEIEADEDTEEPIPGAPLPSRVSVVSDAELQEARATGYAAPAGAAAVETAFGTKLYGSLTSNPRVVLAFRQPFSLVRVTAFLRLFASYIVSIREFSSIDVNVLVSAYVTALQNISVPSPLRVYIQVIAQITAEVLYSNNVLTFEAVSSTSAEVQGAVSGALNQVAEGEPAGPALGVEPGTGLSGPATLEGVQEATAEESSATVAQQDAIAAGYEPTPGAAPVESNFGRQLYASLVENSGFAVAFSGRFSLQRTRAFLVAFITHIIGIPQFRILTLNDLLPFYITGLERLPVPSPLRVYALTIAQITANILYQRNVLSEQAVAATSSAVRTAVSQAVDAELGPAPAGPEVGVLGPQPGLLGPVPGVLGPAPGVLGPATGVLGPAPSVHGPAPGVLDHAPSVLGPSPGLLGLEPGLRGPAIGVLSSSRGVVGQNVETSTNINVEDEGVVDTFSAPSLPSSASAVSVAEAHEGQFGSFVKDRGSSIGNVLPVISSYSAPEGASDVEIAFGSHLYGTLLVNPRFVSVFGTFYSEERGRIFLSALASKIHSFPQFSTIPVSYLLNQYVDAVNAVPSGSSVHLYAQTIARVTSSVLNNFNLLSWSVLASEGAAVDEAAGKAASTLSEEHLSSDQVTALSPSTEDTAASLAASAVLSPTVVSTLLSAEAETRVTSLVSVITSSLPRAGKKFDYLAFARGLSQIFSDISVANPSHSSLEIVVEGLLNALAATFQILEHANLSEISSENSQYVTIALSEALRTVFSGKYV